MTLAPTSSMCTWCHILGKDFPEISYPACTWGSHPYIRIEDELFNSFAHADDINLMCLKTDDVQILINICYQYSREWRFSFGINKTHCMISNKNPFIKYPSWNLGGHKINKANLRDLKAATGLVILLKFDPIHRFFSLCDLEI